MITEVLISSSSSAVYGPLTGSVLRAFNSTETTVASCPAQVYQHTARSEGPGNVADLSPHLSGCEHQRPGGGGDEGHPRHEVQRYGGESHGCQNRRLLWVRRAGSSQHDGSSGPQKAAGLPSLDPGCSEVPSDHDPHTFLDLRLPGILEGFVETEEKC